MINNLAITELAFLLVIFLGAWEFWIPKEKEGKNHIDNYLLTSGYFLFFAFILILIHIDRLKTVFVEFTLTPFIVLAFSFLLFILIYKSFNSRFKRPERIITKYPEESFLYMDYRFLVSKSADIIFQQIAIVTMVIMFQEAGMSLPLMIISFGLIFGLIHIPLVRTKGGVFGAYFVLAAALSAIFFPVLITQIDYGFVYSYVVHWLFYILSAVIFWLNQDLLES
ncbi:MAG: hypothetical protein WD471_01305 [Candidatus Paceibacterota bacterium]